MDDFWHFMLKSWHGLEFLHEVVKYQNFSFSFPFKLRTIPQLHADKNQSNLENQPRLLANLISWGGMIRVKIKSCPNLMAGGVEELKSQKILFLSQLMDSPKLHDI